MEKLKLDVIESLHRRNLDHICDHIFSYLDYGSLSQSKLVSDVWKHVISIGEFWKAMVERKVIMLPHWKTVFEAVKELKKEELFGLKNADGSKYCTYEYYHTMYCLVEDEIQQFVDSNWRAGGKYHCVEYESIRNHTFGFHACECEVGSQFIVQLQQNCRILVRNRWTLQLETILEVPKNQIKMNGGRPLELNRLKLHSNFITASFYIHPEICVWDAKSKELLKVLEPVPEQGNQVEGDYGQFFVKGHCLWKDLLLSCHARISDAGESYIVTLRRIPLNRDGDVTLLYYQKVLTRPMFFLEVAMDDDYIVLFFTEENLLSISGSFEIDIRSAISYDVVRKISIPTASAVELYLYQFHYSNGFIVMGHTNNNSFSILSAASGRFVKTMKFCHGDRTLNAIKIISDKYIVTCDGEGEMKIWDLRAALTSTSKSSSNLLIRKISRLRADTLAASAKPTVELFCMVADELQIVLVSHLNDGTCLLLETFLNAAQ